MKIKIVGVSRERRIVVNQTLAEGSHPRSTFFLFTGLSAMIATLGLLMDSTAVVIGAMLVAPLMTPILGLALSLVQGNSRLFGRALRSEALGVLVAIGVACGIGGILPFYEATPEMLSRTSPHVLDLMVAVFAGAAGAYALVDERVSPALPGVAISTAIVPPLANAGLCLALGAYYGAWGSFLLFFTNFICILLVSAIIFSLAGLAQTRDDRSGQSLARRFGLAVVGFVLLSVFLSMELLDVVKMQRIRFNVQSFLSGALTDYRVSELVRLAVEEEGGTIKVMARVHSSVEPSPRHVAAVERRLEEHMKRPCELYIRSTLTTSVSAKGSTERTYRQTLDGWGVEWNADSERLEKSEQTIREYLGERLGQRLTDLQVTDWGGAPSFLATVRGPRPLRNSEIAEVEGALRERFEDPRVMLVVMQGNQLQTSEGPMHFEFLMRRPKTDEEHAMIEKIEGIAAASLAKSDHSVQHTTLNFLEGRYHVLVEVSGFDKLTVEQLRSLQDDVRAGISQPVDIVVRFLPAEVVTEAGYRTWESLMSEYGARTRRNYGPETQELIRTWR